MKGSSATIHTNLDGIHVSVDTEVGALKALLDIYKV